MGEATGVALGILGIFGIIAAIVVVIAAIVAIIVGFFRDTWNALFCALIGLVWLLLCIILAIGGFQAGMAHQENGGVPWCLMCAVLLHVMMTVRYLPCLSVETERSTYLILGTLLEETESHLVGLGTVVFVPFLYSVPFYIASLFLVDTGFWGQDFIACGIVLIHSVVGFIRSIFEDDFF